MIEHKDRTVKYFDRFLGVFCICPHCNRLPEHLAKGFEQDTRRRVPWDQYFMIIADAVSLRMSCDRARIGAVLTRDNRILATGYGGAPSGLPSCDEVGHELVEINGRQSCVRTVHAEKNALLYAARYGIPIEGATLYTTASTCRDCALACIQAGINRICYAGVYVGARGGGDEIFKLLNDNGVKLAHVPLDEALKWWAPAKSTSSVPTKNPPTNAYGINPDAYSKLHDLVIEMLKFIADAHPGEYCGDWPAAKALLEKERESKLTVDDFSNLRAIRGYLERSILHAPEWYRTIAKILGDTVATVAEPPKKLWQWWAFTEEKTMADAGTAWAINEDRAETIARISAGGPLRDKITRFKLQEIRLAPDAFSDLHDHVKHERAQRSSERCRGGCSRGGEGPACGKPGCEG